MDWNEYFKTCRDSVYLKEKNQYLLSSIGESEQVQDLTVPPNCKGFGRIRHFKRFVADDWTTDPLPIDPACRKLNIPAQDVMKTQVFQIASCNVNCWYCFVPDALKHANPLSSKWFSSDEIIELFQAESFRPQIIDLSGGNPELVPEWIVDTMKSLVKNRLDEDTYLWSDDTLTTDYTFKYLSAEQLDYMKKYNNYGKVACFKGFDKASFAFNTNLPEEFYDKQFEHFERYIDMGIDLYGYITLTSTSRDSDSIGEQISNLMDRYQRMHPLLPLKIIPLKIVPFTPVKSRMNTMRELSLQNQMVAIEFWRKEIKSRYKDSLLAMNIADIRLD